MATLVLNAVGTAIGGPIGGTIGTILGQQIDAKIFGSGSREGPRLQDLKISTSTYGQPIARHYGRMRSPGSIIWSSDLKEQRETSGGGKGQPKVATYSYPVSFAVALASKPIDGIGRIWADGNLLRGAAGDLKTGGLIRIHNGWGDQALDPLLSAAEGPDCPAFRNTAYVVFEDLQLADYGNRIPALSFEIFSGSAESIIAEVVQPLAGAAEIEADFPSLEGFSWEGGSAGETLQVLGTVHPLIVETAGSALTIKCGQGIPSEISLLPEASISQGEGDFGEFTGYARYRENREAQRPSLLRYYDVERAYQAGAQRASGQNLSAHDSTIELPGALNAASARALICEAAQRSLRSQDRLSWRVGHLDPAIALGSLMRAPGIEGTWQLIGWEWRETGVELELLRFRSENVSTSGIDSGRAWLAPDVSLTPTLLRVFELPMAGSTTVDAPSIFAAMSSTSAAWPGASLFADQIGTLIPLGTSSRIRAISGSTLSSLPASPCLRFEPQAEVEVQLADDSFELASCSLDALAFGANRGLIGGEVIQFAEAEKIATGLWRLCGLLRGRGATESAASSGHPAETGFTLLDSSLIGLDPTLIAGAQQIGAIGIADSTPVMAGIENPGLTQRPPFPVHPRINALPDGSLQLCWTRRARGAWVWQDEVEVPLVEASEAYRVGLGPVTQPITSWEVGVPQLTIDNVERNALVSTYGGETLWVRQIGTHALSDPLLLGALN